ncbi:MAG TPA: hypothetical protein VGD40_23520 [Chryseosolibacter sp.]
METLIFILIAITLLVTSILNISAQNAKRTVNKWAKELVDTGRIQSREPSELGTIYSNPFSDWCLEVDKDRRFKILRNERLREKIREYQKYRRFRNRLMLVVLIALPVSLYLFWE